MNQSRPAIQIEYRSKWRNPTSMISYKDKGNIYKLAQEQAIAQSYFFIEQLPLKERQAIDGKLNSDFDKEIVSKLKERQGLDDNNTALKII